MTANRIRQTAVISTLGAAAISIGHDAAAWPLEMWTQGDVYGGGGNYGYIFGGRVSNDDEDAYEVIDWYGAGAFAYDGWGMVDEEWNNIDPLPAGAHSTDLQQISGWYSYGAPGPYCGEGYAIVWWTETGSDYMYKPDCMMGSSG